MQAVVCSLIEDTSFASSIPWLISNDVMIIPLTEQGVGDGSSVILEPVSKLDSLTDE